jgi:flagellar export protein FliJ
MRETQLKIKRVQPVINVKKTKVDEEAASLNEIRNTKVDLVRVMKENQRAYMEGVDKLNGLRNSSNRENLGNLENSLDHVKAQWFQLFRQVQDIEAKEKEQFSRLVLAETELRSAEKLKEKYEADFRSSLAKSEQKQMDEFASRKHSMK